MTVYLRADSVTLELPLDVQRVDDSGHSTGLKASLGGTSRTYRDVLKNITFSAEEGDRIGILGLNGAGKTTLLRVLNGAFPPTLGKVERSGSTQSLLNATLGFAEYATVTENVILRGTAMGLRRRQLEAALPGILEFAGLVDRAAHRLHTLSSGQRMRLGFAISTAIQPDILLMDEWLATGDAAFIQRAQERMSDRVNGSQIVVLASHNTGLIRKLCNKVIVLESGRAVFVGDAAAGLECYRDMVANASAELRLYLAQNDPLLFGETVGVVERVIRQGSTLLVEGWAVSDRGREAGIVHVEVAGTPFAFEKFERKDRDDVRRYTGRSGNFGFAVEVPVAESADIMPLPAKVIVSVGEAKGQLGAPLRYVATGEFVA
ncbi:ABC transporter ATP-binding protein [Lysobacter niastensis]|uniref:ABC transporter ATP-binding protein n=1 Tax=Lysobacter niastensis TaxID=380629 RepID=A0ABS0B9Z2_9GAMM|nr:ATP-binding cassette domain-containing protein [Lysobacter niastensis]MBF6025824.1 ABC transporter ATP-binding protein [Lysobacter niastensis]